MPESSQTQVKTEPTANNTPKISPPKYRLFRSKINQGISLVVSPNTSDEQLKSLLWLLREKIRSHHFRDIGIMHPTSTQWGQKGYLSGMINIYRGSKCANEGFDDSGIPGPCGYGDHSAASYQWGLLVDGEFNTDADSAAIRSGDGRPIKIFDYTDNWRPPISKVASEAKNNIEQNTDAEQAKEISREITQKTFADGLQQRLRSSGFDVEAWVDKDITGELDLDSKMFQDTPTRVEFLNSVLPHWRRDLCAAGFQEVKLIRGSIFSPRSTYSLDCK